MRNHPVLQTVAQPHDGVAELLVARLVRPPRARAHPRLQAGDLIAELQCFGLARRELATQDLGLVPELGLLGLPEVHERLEQVVLCLDAQEALV